MTSYLNTINGQSGGSDQSMGSINPATVWINQHRMVHPMVPSGGIKGSGYGVEFGVEGLKAVTRPQVISIKT